MILPGRNPYVKPCYGVVSPPATIALAVRHNNLAYISLTVLMFKHHTLRRQRTLLALLERHFTVRMICRRLEKRAIVREGREYAKKYRVVWSVVQATGIW